jgi:lysophospholipase L1-like esterase
MRRVYSWKRLWLFCALAASAALLAEQGKDPGFYLKDGDRVVFYGDSITDQRLYTAFIEAYVVTRLPGLGVTFIHSGWGGDRVTGGGGGPVDLRLARDVVAYKPAVVTVMLGMNDAGYQAYNQKIFETYSQGLKHIVDSLRAALPGVRITLIQPSPFDDVTRAPQFEGGYNAVLLKYGDYVKKLAGEDGLTVADLNAPVVRMLEKAKAGDPKLAEKIIPDRVHPGPGGHLIMAEALLESWHAPVLVSSVVLDAREAKAVETENAQVADLKSENGLSWTETDGALPMPIDLGDPVVSLALRSSDFVEKLDQEPLRVSGLAAGDYELKIDGESVKTFTDRELSGGVNLATLPTPMLKQAQRVYDLTVKHNLIHFARWRMVQVPLQDSSLGEKPPTLDQLDKLEADLVADQRAAAQPKPHHFELKLSSGLRLRKDTTAEKTTPQRPLFIDGG